MSEPQTIDRQAQMRDRIPEEFYKGRYPQIRTVGDLASLVDKLPHNLPIQMGVGTGAQAVVYNVSSSKAFLTFEETDEECD